MTTQIFDSILAFTEGIRLWGTQDVCSRSSRLLEVAVNIHDLDVDVMGHLTRAGRPKRCLVTPAWRLTLTWTDEEDGAFADSELCSCKIAFRSIAETFHEAEGFAQPIDGSSDILINKTGGDRAWCC